MNKFKFGKIILLEILPKLYKKLRKAKYLCFCGTEFITSTYNIKIGDTKSCGCYRKWNTTKFNFIHGMTDSKLHNKYCVMFDRCYNKNSKQYKDYGGRGITICEEWKDFTSFYNWAKKVKYKDNLTLDRINNDGNYEPSNCRFTSRQVQAINKRAKSNKNGFAGVAVSGNKYYAQIFINKKNINLGYFDTAMEAHKIYLVAKEKRDSNIYKKAL